MARRNREAIDAPEFKQNQPARVELRRQNVVRAYLLTMLYDFAVTGGTGAGTIFEDAHARLLRFLQFKIGGRDLIAVSGQLLRLYQRVFGLREFVQLRPTTLAAGNENGRRAWWFLPLFMPHSFNEDQFAAPTSILPVMELVVTWGVASDMTQGENGALAISNPDVDLYEVFHDDPALPLASYDALRMVQYTREITQSGPVRIQLTELVPGDEIRAVFVELFGGGAAGADYEYNDAVATHLRLVVSGDEVRKRVPVEIIQQDNRVVYDLDQIITGLAVLDAAEDKSTATGQLWTVAGQTTPTLDVDAVKVAGDCKVVVTVVYVRGRLAA